MSQEYQEIIPLTDPVVDDISRPAADVKPALSPQKPVSSFTIPLIIITLLAVAAASLFYNQTQQLKTQVQDLTNTLEAQGIAPISEKGQTLRPVADIEPVSDLQDLVSTPSSTPLTTPQSQTEVHQAISLAQQKYPDAQLILITSDNPHLAGQEVTKYWFRQSTASKKYLYISFIANEPNLVDQQIYLSPDNNIPSLNKRAETEELGLTQTQSLELANSLCNQPEKCQQATGVKTQFLDTGNLLLWQITYQISDSSQPIVFQINSLTKEVVYQSQK